MDIRLSSEHGLTFNSLQIMYNCIKKAKNNPQKITVYKKFSKRRFKDP